MEENNVNKRLANTNNQTTKTKKIYEENYLRNARPKKKEAYYNIWTRPTIMWSLECESEGLTVKKFLGTFDVTNKPHM